MVESFSRQQYKFLIVIDNGNRDILPSRLLEKKLCQLGHIVKCCNKRDFIVSFRDFKPDGCVVPRGDWPFVRSLAKYCKVFLMPSEGARLTPETMLSVFVGRVHNREQQGKRLDQNNNVIDSFDHISKVFLWGPQSKEFLMRSGFFKEDQLCISGNSRLDIYRHLPEKNNTDKKFVVGVAFSAKTASMFDGSYQYAELLYGLEQNSHLPLVPEGGHWEDYAWRDFAILRHMMWLIKKIINETNHKILIRVGPLENQKDLMFLKKRYPDRVEIQERSGQLFDFLKNINCLLTCWSTTGIEAQLLNIPTIGIPFLISKDRLLYHVKAEANGFDTFLRCYHTPETMTEAMSMIENCRLGLLPVAKEAAFFADFIKKVYFWPSDKSATSIIASEMINCMAGFKYVEQDSVQSDLRLPTVFDKLLRIKIIPRRLVFMVVRTLRFIKNIQLDMRAGSFAASRSFHADNNAQARILVENTNLD